MPLDKDSVVASRGARITYDREFLLSLRASPNSRECPFGATIPPEIARSPATGEAKVAREPEIGEEKSPHKFRLRKA